VTSIGFVETKNTGSAIITVKTVDGDFIDTCALTVLPVPVTGISLNITESSITDLKGLFRILRYIYRNPVVAGLCKNVDGYMYSSYVKDMDDLREYLESQNISLKDLTEYVEKPSPKDVIFDALKFVSDEFVKKVIFEISHVKNATQFQALSKELRNIKLLALKKRGFYAKQIARVTGISIGVIKGIS
jgi:hypothetical protein